MISLANIIWRHQDSGDSSVYFYKDNSTFLAGSAEKLQATGIAMLYFPTKDCCILLDNARL